MASQHLRDSPTRPTHFPFEWPEEMRALRSAWFRRPNRSKGSRIFSPGQVHFFYTRSRKCPVLTSLPSVPGRGNRPRTPSSMGSHPAATPPTNFQSPLSTITGRLGGNLDLEAASYTTTNTAAASFSAVSEQQLYDWGRRVCALCALSLRFAWPLLPSRYGERRQLTGSSPFCS